MFDKEYLKSQTILFVEDEDLAREKLSKILSKLFKNVITAANGLEGFEKFQNSETIDLILSDINMPIMDGLEMLEKIREIDPNVPLIFVTARTETDNLLKAIDLNVSNYIIKPLNTTLLIEKISLASEKKYIKKQLEEKQNELEKYLEAVDHVALIYKMDENGNITFANKSLLETSLYTLEELTSLNFNDLIHPDIAKDYLNKTWETLEKNEIWSGNTKFISKGKEAFYLKNTIFKLQTNSKKEFITIGFSTTKESIEKREFNKKVLQTIQSFNKKESSYKKLITELSDKVKQLESYIPRIHQELQEQKEKTLSKHRQLEHYELQMHNVDEKLHSQVIEKTKELEESNRTILLVRQECANLVKKVKASEEEINATKKELKLLMETGEQKNKKIIDLNDVIKSLEIKIRELTDQILDTKEEN
jgi:PAS domain S-box-containing protein